MDKIGCEGIKEPTLPQKSTEKQWGQNRGEKRNSLKGMYSDILLA